MVPFVGLSFSRTLAPMTGSPVESLITPLTLFCCCTTFSDETSSLADIAKGCMAMNPVQRSRAIMARRLFLQELDFIIHFILVKNCMRIKSLPKVGDK